jgi:methyl-accepting chemotaxis protein
MVAIVPLITLIGINIVEQFQYTRHTSEREVLHLTQTFSLQQEQLIETSRQFLVSLAHIPKAHTAEECSTHFANLLSKYPSYANIGAIAPNGDIFCSGLLQDQDQIINAADRSYFARVVETGDFAIGDYQIGRITGEPSLNFGYPVYSEDDNLIAVVFVALKLDWVADYAAQQDIPQGATLMVIDRKGTVLATYPTNSQYTIGKPFEEEAVFAQIQQSDQANMIEAPSMQGEPTFYAFSPLGTFAESAYITISIPQKTVFATVYNKLIRDVIIVVIIALVAFAISWVGVHRFITTPIKKLAQTTHTLADGDMSARTRMTYDGSEIGDLAESVDHMAETLQQQYQRVTEESCERERLQEKERQEHARMQAIIKSYLAFIDEVSHGNLTERLLLEQDDAMEQDNMLGHLGLGLNSMVESLHSITTQVQQASNDISTAVRAILAATTQQASSTSEQSSALEQTNTTMEQIRNIVRQNMQQATLVAQESQSALLIAQQGTDVVEKTVSAIERIRQQMESIAQTILGLAEQTQAIGNITTTVSELADQSNMLALNAAIEAARAGEQGKSFAVVAQQVRDLAERSKAATAQVQDILGEIQRASNAAVMVTEEGTKGVEAGTSQAQKAGDIIRRIVAEVESGSQENIQMASATQQASVGLDQIGQALTSIQQTTKETLTGTRKTEETARMLHELAQKMEAAITSYRL